MRWGGSGGLNTGTLIGANDAELRDLAVENTGGDQYATAVCNNGTSPRLTRVTASASGGANNYGVYNRDNASPTMTDITATASGGGTNYAVYNSRSSPRMTDVIATASSGSNNYGVYNEANASPEMTSVVIKVTGGTSAYGVFNHNGSSPTMTRVTASASGASSDNCGVYNGSGASLVMTDCSVVASGGQYSSGVATEDASATIRRSSIRAGGASMDSRAIRFGTTEIARTVRVDHSYAEGTDASISGGSGYTINVSASQLIGSVLKYSGSTFKCFGNYDGNLNAVSCP